MIEQPTNILADHCASAIRAAFDGYHTAFKAVTRQATQRFEQRAWLLMHADAEQRLDLYKTYVDQTVADLRRSLETQVVDKAFWHAVKERYTQAVAGRPDWDLAESFYNSVTMRVVPRFEIDPAIEYVGTEFHAAAPEEIRAVYTVYPAGNSTPDLIRTLLLDCHFACPYADLERDTAARGRRDRLQAGHPRPARRQFNGLNWSTWSFTATRAPISWGGSVRAGIMCRWSLVLHNNVQGIYVDAVLLDERMRSASSLALPVRTSTSRSNSPTRWCAS